METLDDALPIAKQIAEALEAAHEAGVIHRDLKPANIKVREDGTVKVLDFGLAKALDPAPEADPSQSPTLTAAATQMGVVLGTAAYMSPEQASGDTVDKRSDIWSFGVVVFEMLTGGRLFDGKTVAHVMSAVIQVDPKWDTLPTATPESLTRLLRRCLHKERRRRLRDIGDALTDLDEALIAPPARETASAGVAQTAGWRQALPWVAGIALAVATGVAGWTLKPTPMQPVSRFAASAPPSAPVSLSNNGRDAVISRDGTRVVYRAPGDGVAQLHVRALDQLESVPLRGAEDAFHPFVSPDGAWVGFMAGTGGPLQKVSIFGGPPVMVCELPANLRGASWGPDDVIIFGTASVGGLMRVPGAGGEPEAITTPQGERHVWPDILPGGAGVLFTVDRGPGLGSEDVALLNLDTGEHHVIIPGGTHARYSPTGHIVYGVEGTLRAVAFDLDTLEVTSDPVPVVEGVLMKGSGAAAFDFSDSGSLVYIASAGDITAGLPTTLVRVGRDGASTPLAEIAGNAWYPRFSPDGSRLAFGIAQGPGAGGDADLWVLDIERGTRTRLTFESNNRFYPVWSPDGAQLAFADGAGAENRILLIPSDGSGEPETLLDRNERQFPMSWAPDGSALALYRDAGETGRDLYVLPLDGDGTPVLFLSTPFQDRGVSFSPNGQWLAYVSAKAGRDEIYVRPYPGPGGEVIVSTGGGQEAVWGSDGTELFYRNGDQMMVVATETEDRFLAEAPRVLFEGNFVLDNAAGGGGNPNYDIAPDGQSFVMVVNELGETTDDAIAIPVIVVQNWFEDLKRLVPVP